MSNQRIDGAGGNQTGHGTENATETGTASGPLWLPSKRSVGSTMSGAGRIGSGAKKKARNITLGHPREGVTTPGRLLLRRRSPTLNCQERSQKTPTRSEEW